MIICHLWYRAEIATALLDRARGHCLSLLLFLSSNRHVNSLYRSSSINALATALLRRGLRVMRLCTDLYMVSSNRHVNSLQRRCVSHALATALLRRGLRVVRLCIDLYMVSSNRRVNSLQRWCISHALATALLHCSLSSTLYLCSRRHGNSALATVIHCAYGSLILSSNRHGNVSSHTIYRTAIATALLGEGHLAILSHRLL